MCEQELDQRKVLNRKSPQLGSQRRLSLLEIQLCDMSALTNQHKDYAPRMATNDGWSSRVRIGVGSSRRNVLSRPAMAWMS